MTSFITRGRLALGTAFLLPLVAVMGLLAMETAIAPSTYAMVGALLAATAAVAFIAWKNGQATASMGQLLHETEVAAGAGGDRSADDRRAP